MLDHFKGYFTYTETSSLLSLIKLKIQRALQEEDNFLLYVRNPVKVLLLLNELLSRSLSLLRDNSHLRYEAKEIMETLSQLARRILMIEPSEEKTRLALTDTDLEGRDALTIICENDEV